MGTIANFHQRPTPFFLFVLLLLGLGGRHHQVLIESQAPFFFFFFSLCFIACGCKWASSSTFIKEGAQFPFF
jgi:hypothetical protein